MQHRPLGRTGLSIAPVVFGGNVFGWTADEKTSFALLDAFFDAGLNTIDTADVYSRWVPGHSGGESETIIGKWLKRGHVARDRAVIATKVGSDMGQGHIDLSEKWIVKAVEDSLTRLQTDYIDLYLSHWPDPNTPYEETLGAFARLKEAGKVRAIGTSNLDAVQLRASLDAAKAAGLPRYDVIQPEYSLVKRDAFEGPLADLCVAEDIGVITYFSLAAGFLSGKYRTKEDAAGKARANRVEACFTERGEKVLAALDEAVKATGASHAAVAIAWLIRKRGVTAPIASATSLSQLESLVAAATLELSTDVMALLDEAGA